ncbi:MAG: hypothetical protein U0894_20815 [Pirellulales bacterium]
MGDLDGDDLPELIRLNWAANQRNHELHALSGASNYQKYSVHATLEISNGEEVALDGLPTASVLHSNRSFGHRNTAHIGFCSSGVQRLIRFFYIDGPLAKLDGGFVAHAVRHPDCLNGDLLLGTYPWDHGNGAANQTFIYQEAVDS